MPISQTSSILEIDSSPEPVPLHAPKNHRRTRSQGPPTPPRASNTSPKRKAPPAAACSRKKGRILGPVIELTDSEDDDDADVPMRLAPKPSQGNVNAVASGSGTRHSDTEDAGSEVEVVDYDPEFAAKPFPFDEAFLSASQKTPRKPSQPVAGPSRVRPPAAPVPVPVPHTPATATATPSRHPSSSFRGRTAHTPRLLAELDGHAERVRREAEEQAAPKAPVPPPVATVAAAPPPAAIVPAPPVRPAAPVVSAPPIPPPAAAPAAAVVPPPSAAPAAPAPPVQPAAPVVAAPPVPLPAAVPPVAPLAPVLEPALALAPAAVPDPDPAPIAIAAPPPAPAPALVPPPAPAPAAPVPPAEPAPALLEALVQLAITQILDVLPEIERVYLERVVRAHVPALGADTGERVLGWLMESGAWPRRIVGGGVGGEERVGGGLAPNVAVAAVPPVADERPAAVEPQPAPVPDPAHIAVAVPAAAVPQHHHQPAEPDPDPDPAPAPAPAVDPEALITTAIAQVLEVLPEIDRAYLARLVRANVGRLGRETGERVLGWLVEGGGWPRAVVVDAPGAAAGAVGGAAGGDPGPDPGVAPEPAPVAAAVPAAAAAAQHEQPALPAQPAQPPAPAPAAPAAPDPADPDALVNTAIAQVLEVLPDVERAYLAQCVRALVPEHGAETGGAVLGALVEGGAWPKEPVKVVGGAGGVGGVNAEGGNGGGKGKGRAMEEAAEGRGEAKRVRVDYESVDRPFVGGVYYTEVALIHLQCAFPYTPKLHLRRVLAEHRNHYAPTYLYLHRLQARLCARALWDPGYAANKTKFDARRKEGLIAGRRDAALEEEVRWVEERIGAGDVGAGGHVVDKGKGKARAVEEAPEEDAAAEDEDEEGGIECQCCFADYPFTQMVQCPEAHLFCVNCVKTYASTELAASSAALVCMHSSGCALPFPVSELARALPTSLMELYERVAAAKAVEEAGLEGLEACPFCEWQCVMEVGGEERLFRCGNVGRCGAVSCRGCKKRDHLPKTCEEMEADKHLDGRHAIEEAMTRALMRNCPKCKKAFIKELGCNKMTCPNCRTLSCYICRKAITGYEHFNQNNPNQRAPIAQGSNAKCLLWDEVETRHAADVKAAADEAMKAYREAHPDVDENAIKVDIPVAPPPKPPQVPPAAPAQVHWHVAPPPMVPLYHPPPAIRGVVPPQPPPPQPAPRLDAQALQRHRHALALAERERKAQLSAVRAERKEAQRERKAERARMQAVVQAQMAAMEAQREYGRRQMALEMQREQQAAMGREQTFAAAALPPPPVKRPRHQPR
ncbi:hypothetical protein BJ912DRAFT_1141053 [Pholiota molesta]|nr:hypothetical protein BJ912DRAFT_1141053 [Pholiota molesta]